MLQSDKSDVKKEINLTNEVFKKQLFEQVDNLKNYVGRIDATAATNRDEMQDKYNEKLAKIKDVCAQYFSKYEKHLMHQAELVKALEQRQEAWVNKLIKPQEVN